VLTFPKALGGETYTLCIAGSYTFVARPPQDDILNLISSGVRRCAAAVRHTFARSTAQVR
jgi:hypothetical protein